MNPGRATVLTALVLLAFSQTKCASTAGSACAMSAEDASWLRSAVETWNAASVLLERRVEVFPRAIVYDAECAWHLNPPPASRSGVAVRRPSLSFQGKSVRVRVVRHAGAIELPSGQTLDARPLAFTGLSRNGASFFVMALPAQWTKHPAVNPGEDIGAFARGVFAHEITHTIHLKAISDKFQEMSGRYDLPAQLNDDYLQSVFDKNPEYVEAYKREEALLWESLGSADDVRARELAREALRLAEARRSTYFTGKNAFFIEAEPIFLNMEGVATWVAYSVGEKAGDPEEQSGRFWSQRHGLALFLLLDRFDPDWKRQVFLDEIPNPYAMLRETVK